MTGEFDTTVVLDGNSQNVTAVTASPPDADGSPPSGEAYVNFDTGEVVTGDASSGSGSGIEVTYHDLSWTDAFTNISGDETDLTFLANRFITVEDIGDVDELVTWGSGNYTFTIGAVDNGNNYSSDDAYRQAAQDVSSYLVSSDLALWAHKSSDDVAAAVTGWFATQRPWQDPTFAEIDVSSDDIRLAEVGDPETSSTFEGGDSNGAGPLNVLVRRQGTLVSSNDLTTAGAGSNYRYLDVRRTEGFVASEAKDSLIGLALQNSDGGIPFNDTGQVMIQNALIDRLSRYDYPRGPYTNLNIVVPSADELTQSQRANRIWGDIDVAYRVAGNVHRFRVRIAASS